MDNCRYVSLAGVRFAVVYRIIPKPIRIEYIFDDPGYKVASSVDDHSSCLSYIRFSSKRLTRYCITLETINVFV